MGFTPALATHQAVLDRVQGKLREDPDVIGVMIQGSVARGDAFSASDLDLYVLLRAGCQNAFRAETHDGILVEEHRGDRERAAEKLRKNPMLTYGFIDGYILWDETGALKELRRLASDLIAAYEMPARDREGIRHWLQSARIKIAAASAAGDLLRSSFVVSTTSFKILEGLWAVNHRPMPPSGTVLPHLDDLLESPMSPRELFARLFLGDTEARIQTALSTIDWLLPRF